MATLRERVGDEKHEYCKKCGRTTTWILTRVRRTFSNDSYYWKCFRCGTTRSVDA